MLFMYVRISSDNSFILHFPYSSPKFEILKLFQYLLQSGHLSDGCWAAPTAVSPFHGRHIWFVHLSLSSITTELSITHIPEALPFFLSEADVRAPPDFGHPDHAKSFEAVF